MSMKDVLRNNTPEFLKAYDELSSFLDAAGEYLQGSKDAIESFDASHDYEKSSKFQLKNSLQSIGFEIPPYLDDEVSRVVLRDAIQLFIKKGTLDSLVWVLKVIGLSPVIRQAWLPSPQDVRKGKIRNITTGDLTRYDVNKFSYTDFLYGEEEVTENGNVFRGYTYDDLNQENPLDPIPIFGEQYIEPVDSETYVEKLPYVIIRVTDQDFNVVTEPYVDPETGEEFEYSISEEFQAVEDMIDYFLYQTGRSANVRIILIASLQNIEEIVQMREDLDQQQNDYSQNNLDGMSLSDENLITTASSLDHSVEDFLGYSEEATQEATSDSDDKSDSLVNIDAFSDESTTTVNSFSIGSPIKIGNDSPYISQYDTFVVEHISEENQTYSLSNYEDFDKTTLDTFIKSDTNGVSEEIPLKVGSSLIFTALQTDIEVHAKELYGSSETPQVIMTVNSSNSVNFSVPYQFHSIQFISPSGTEFDIPVQIYY